MLQNERISAHVQVHWGIETKFYGNAGIPSRKPTGIIPRHLQLVIGNVEELNKLLHDVTFAQGSCTMLKYPNRLADKGDRNQESCGASYSASVSQQQYNTKRNL